VGNFSSGPNLPAALRQHCVTYYDDTSVIITGGSGSNKAYVYNFTTESFTTVTNMDRVRFGHSCYRVSICTRIICPSWSQKIVVESEAPKIRTFLEWNNLKKKNCGQIYRK
jgi:hypothetical protein